MQTLDVILDIYAASLKDIVAAVESISDSAMTAQPAGQVNHPDWMLSHIANAAAFVGFLLEEPLADVGPHDMEHFGPGSIPVADRTLYASKAELLDRLKHRHAIVDRVVRAKLPDYFLQ